MCMMMNHASGGSQQRAPRDLELLPRTTRASSCPLFIIIIIIISVIIIVIAIVIGITINTCYIMLYSTMIYYSSIIGLLLLYIIFILIHDTITYYAISRASSCPLSPCCCCGGPRRTPGHTHTHTHICIYIYIYACNIYIYIYIYIYNIFRSFDDRMSESPPGISAQNSVTTQRWEQLPSHLANTKARRGGQEAPPNPGNRGPTLF